MKKAFFEKLSYSYLLLGTVYLIDWTGLVPHHELLLALAALYWLLAISHSDW